MKYIATIACVFACITSFGCGGSGPDKPAAGEISEFMADNPEIADRAAELRKLEGRDDVMSGEDLKDTE